MVLSPEQRAARETAFRAGRKGDSVVAVARRHGLTPTQVAQWNGVTTNARFKPGQRIVLMKTTAPKASAKAAVRASSKTAATATAAPKTLKKAPAKAPSKAPLKKSGSRAQRPK